jgi:PAS domain S-box-containing protein
LHLPENNPKKRKPPKHAARKPARRARESFAHQKVSQKASTGQPGRERIDGSILQNVRGEKIVTLQATDQPYRVLIESVNDGAATLDAAGTIRYANSRFAEILNLTPAELVGSSLENTLPDWQRPKLRALIKQAHRQATGLELTLDATEARPKLVRFTLKPLKGNQLHQIGVVATELTELVQASEALKSNEQSLRQLSARLLQIQDEERRHIARDLHDVTGQKLAFQCMALSGILNRHSASLPADAQQALSESLALNKEVSAEIRTLSYLLHPPLLDELGLPSAARWYAAGFTKRTGIPIDVDIAPTLGRFSPDAEVAIFRVLQESLTNVHRYSNTKRARLSIRTTDDLVRLEVEDFGQGIQKVKAKSPSTGVQRLGVGIQGMTERMRQLGGDLEIISKPNRGTLVSATLPISSAQAATDAHSARNGALSTSFVHTDEPVAPHNSARKRVLLADGHEILRRGLRDILRTQPDLEVCGEAVNGQNAVDKVKELNPDLVILDINMPVLNGLLAVRQILRHRPETRIVVFSVHNSDQTLHEAQAAGAHAFVPKNADAQALLCAIREVLEPKPPTPSARAAAPSG